MLKHVHNTTLSRRPSKQDSIETDVSGFSSIPSSPTPSTISATTSCSSFNFSSTSSSPPAVPETGYDCSTLPHFNKNRSSSLDESANACTSTSTLTWKRCKNKLKTMRKGSLECGRLTGVSGLTLAAAARKARTGSSLSIVSGASTVDLRENSIALRVYAGCLRPDIQYKTVGITNTTTCDQVVDMVFNKCKLPFKDPKLFYLALDVKIRNSDGTTIDASLPLEGNSCPVKLQECYPSGQAKFSLQMSLDGKLVRIYDKSGALGWDYKGVMISDKTTASELLDILFRFSSSNSEDADKVANIVYTLHVEVDEQWSQKLEPSDMIIPMQTIATQFGQSTKLILKSRQADEESLPESRSSSSMSARHSCFLKQGQRIRTQEKPEALRSSTVSLRDNRNRHRHHVNQVFDRYSTHSLSLASTTPTDEEDSSGNSTNEARAALNEYWRRRRSHSLSSSSGDSSSIQSHEDFIRRRRRGRYHHLDLIDGDDQDDQLMNRFRRLGIANEDSNGTGTGTIKAKARSGTTNGSGNNVYNRIFFNSDKYQLSETFLV